MRNAEVQPIHVVLVVPTTWRNGDSTGKMIVDTNPTVGAVGTPVIFSMSKMFGNMRTPGKRTIRVTTDIEIVEIGVVIGAKNGTGINTRSEFEVAARGVEGIETRREDPNIHIGEVRIAQGVTAAVTGKVTTLLNNWLLLFGEKHFWID